MATNRFVVSSSLGRYLEDDRPRGATNSFLYHQPSILLWADEIVCDDHAFQGEQRWAEEGWLISEVFTNLAKAGVVKPRKFARYFTADVTKALIRVSEDDFDTAPLSDTFFPTATVDPQRASARYNGFFDINAHLYVSSLIDASFLEDSHTAQFYRWKVERAAVNEDRNALAAKVFERILELRVPSLSLFPRNRQFLQVKRATARLFRDFQKCCAGSISLAAYRRVYDDSLRTFESYEKPIGAEVHERLQDIMELRRDSRLQHLRKAMRTVASRISAPGPSHRRTDEIDLELQREILEIERAIAEDLRTFDKYEKVESYASTPFSLFSLLGWSAIAAVTNNPAFVVAGAGPPTVGWVARLARRWASAKTQWYSYLTDAEARLSRSAQLRDVDTRLAKLRRTTRRRKP